MKQLTCNTCLKVKNVISFGIRKDRSKGFCSSCKECLAKEKRKARSKDPLKHRRQSIRSYYKRKKQGKIKPLSIKQLEIARSRRKEYYSENKEKVLAKAKIYYQENKKKIIKRNALYKTKLFANKPEKKAIANLYSVYRSAIKRACNQNPIVRKRLSSYKNLGCNSEMFKVYIESKFKEGMYWSNYGAWEIDHIFPLSKINLNDLDSLAKVLHYTNLQPLWAIENKRKSNKIV